MIKNYNIFVKKYIHINEALMVDPKNPKIDKKAYLIIKNAIMKLGSQNAFFFNLVESMNIKQVDMEEFEKLPEEQRIYTAATDGRNILYNPEFIIGCYEPKLVGNDCDQIIWVLCHEVMHCALFHFMRTGSRDPHWFNRAGDYAINLLLEGNRGLKMPINIKNEKGKVIFDGPLIDTQFTDMSSEQIYDIITKGKKVINVKKSKPSDKDFHCPECDENLGGVKVQVTKDGKSFICPNCGAIIPIPPSSGKGEEGKGKGPIIPGQKSKGKGKGEPSDGEVGGTDEEPSDLTMDDMMKNDVHEIGAFDNTGVPIKMGWEGTTSKDQEELKSQWMTNRETAAKRFQGSGSANLKRWIKSLTIAEVDWKSELKKFVANCYEKNKYVPWNRRTVATRGYPSISAIKDDVANFDSAIICVDTSGSITDQDLAIFAAEMNGIAQARKIKTLRVIWCDSTVDSVQVFGEKKTLTKKEEYSGPVKDFNLRLKPRGGGGTSFVPPFLWINENIPRRNLPAFIVYFTDAQGDAPSPQITKEYENRIMWIVHPKTMDCSALGVTDDYVDTNDKGEIIPKMKENATRRRWKVIRVNGLIPKK